MIIQAGYLGVELNTGTNTPGAVLQHRQEGVWVDYLHEGQPVLYPVDIKSLPPGYYRLQEKRQSESS